MKSAVLFIIIFPFSSIIFVEQSWTKKFVKTIPFLFYGVFVVYDQTYVTESV